MDKHWIEFYWVDVFFLYVFKVIKETEEFEKSLKEMQYLQGDSTDLLKYARDVNCHFASKKCKDVIVAARKLMTSKMHNTVKVCTRAKSLGNVLETSVRLSTCVSKQIAIYLA